MKSERTADEQGVIESRRGEYVVSTDPAKLDLDVIHGFLTNCYWAKGIPRETVERSIEHSLCFGIYHGSEVQVGFARVVTDHATFAYLADVFVLPAERGQGLGRWLVESILAHPGLQDLRRWLLGTRNAHGLYRRCGFSEPAPPFAFLERHEPEIYSRGAVARRPRRALAEPRPAY